MIKVSSIHVFTVSLPFRFAFKHSLASRSSSQNVIVRVTLENTVSGATFNGLGESVPREYVTGETVESAVAEIKNKFAPALVGTHFSESIPATDAVASLIERLSIEFDVYGRRIGAAFCALELALLDAAAKLDGVALADWLAKRKGNSTKASISYGGVIPFGKRKILSGMLLFYKYYGFKTVKLKVGVNPDEDFWTVKQSRKILGPGVTIRVDANCAWDYDTTMAFAKLNREFNIASIEQPVPFDKLDVLAALTKDLKEEIVVDESLCTVDEAENLALKKACSGFNIRVSKVGGILAAQRIIDIAQRSGISCHLGAQVGESGILTAAGRALACANSTFENYEGAANFFLLKEDLTKENLTAGPNGIGKLPSGTGIGVTVNEENLGRFVVKASTTDGATAAVIEPTGRGLHV